MPVEEYLLSVCSQYIYIGQLIIAIDTIAFLGHSNQVTLLMFLCSLWAQPWTGQMRRFGFNTIFSPPPQYDVSYNWTWNTRVDHNAKSDNFFGVSFHRTTNIFRIIHECIAQITRRSGSIQYMWTHHVKLACIYFSRCHYGQIGNALIINCNTSNTNAGVLIGLLISADMIYTSYTFFFVFVWIALRCVDWNWRVWI